MNWFNSISQFVKEAYFELKKVTWLGRKEMIASTIVVIMLVVALAIFVGLIDFVLVRALRIFL